jgi:hypothetical protein
MLSEASIVSDGSLTQPVQHVRKEGGPKSPTTLSPLIVGSSSQADYLKRNAAMDDSIGGS